MKVAILNVKYSPNLGDGLLAECLECELRRHHPCIELIPIDLAGRTKYDRHGRHRAAAMRTLEWLPQPLRRAAALTVLSHLPGWRWTRALFAVPKSLRDAVYGLIARNRYKIFGKYETCFVPDADLRARVLE